MSGLRSALRRIPLGPSRVASPQLRPHRICPSGILLNAQDVAHQQCPNWAGRRALAAARTRRGAGWLFCCAYAEVIVRLNQLEMNDLGVRWNLEGAPDDRPRDRLSTTPPPVVSAIRHCELSCDTVLLIR